MKLIVNGDDFGFTHGCNLAIIDCYLKGILTSASLMTSMEYAAEAAELWKDHPGLSVGVHLCLSAGKPLTDCSSLLKADGSFDKAILRNHRKISLEEVHQELEAQIRKFISLTGRKPDHINSHHGIEQIHGVPAILDELSRKYDIPLRSYLSSKEDEIQFGGRYVQAPVAGGLNHPGPDPNSPWNPVEMVREITQEMISSDGFYELAAHPAYADADLMENSSLNIGRVYDARAFLSRTLRYWIRDHHIKLITYKDLPVKDKTSEGPLTDVC